jgi:hypothetical protein
VSNFDEKELAEAVRSGGGGAAGAVERRLDPARGDLLLLQSRAELPAL